MGSGSTAKVLAIAGLLASPCGVSIEGMIDDGLVVRSGCLLVKSLLAESGPHEPGGFTLVNDDLRISHNPSSSFSAFKFPELSTLIVTAGASEIEDACVL